MTIEKNSTAKSSSSGFTVIEVTIVAVISSLFLAAGIGLYKGWWSQSQLTTNKARMSAIQQALTNYMDTHNRLPCPSNYTDATTATTYGREFTYPATTGCTTTGAGPGTYQATGRTNTPGNSKIMIGAVPVRDLGLPDLDRMDTYGYLFTYAVTESLTPAPCSTCTTVIPPLDTTQGAIQVMDKTGLHSILPLAVSPQTGSGTATYVLVDHGRDGQGAYVNGSTSPTPAILCGTGYDINNCNHYGSTYFMSAPFSTKSGSTHFDDLIVYATPTATATSAAATSACTTLYSAATTAGTSQGHYYDGNDTGNFVGFGFVEYALAIQSKFIMSFENAASYTGTGPVVDAYCTVGYNAMGGGCTQTLGIASTTGPATNLYGFDTNVISQPSRTHHIADGTLVNDTISSWLNVPDPQWWDIFYTVSFDSTIPSYPFNYSQYVMPFYSHPALPSSGQQGWECNGSSASGISTQAYVICCPQNGG